MVVEPEETGENIPGGCLLNPLNPIFSYCTSVPMPLK